ncbi:MAG: DMT family transporter [Paludibacterium sp.]|uniref:DMT family transporter n=1 Tax=Paludibacterium sp. TaxID=1917523 RepID=UPI0025CF4C1C|nr:DMT family transporter [Paludibacterium sp.]MBV8048069.1 DMT family transporter [Paludibacterium sp.]MBV8646952.1 DMT family transporter [Paludibacterium sp.]
MQNATSIRSYLLLLGIGVVWGGQFVFNAQAIESLPPATVAAARAVLGALTLSLVSYFKPEPRLGAKPAGSLPLGRLLMLIALFETVLPLFLIAWGQQHVSSSVTAVLVGSVPIVTLLLSTVMSARNHFTVFSGLSVLLGFLAIWVLVDPGADGLSEQHTLIYEGAIFLGVISFGISLNLMEKIPLHAPIRSTRNMLWLSSAPLLLVALLFDQPWSLSWGMHNIVPLMLLGVLGSGLAYLMYTALVQQRGSVFTSLSNFIVPMVGVLLGVLARGEDFGARQGWALGLIIAALAVNEMRGIFRARQAV